MRTLPPNHHNHQHQHQRHHPMKIHRDSHAIIKKSSSSPSSPAMSSSGSVSSVMASRPQQQRAPVIIYTQAPKVIHTNPDNFRELVQKLTGMSQSEVGHASKDVVAHRESSNHVGTKGFINDAQRSNDCKTMVKMAFPGNNDNNNNSSNNNSLSNDDTESSSVITDENSNSSVGQMNHWVRPGLFDPDTPQGPSVSIFPLYNMPDTLDLLPCGGDSPFYDYVDLQFPYNHVN